MRILDLSQIIDKTLVVLSPYSWVLEVLTSNKIIFDDMRVKNGLKPKVLKNEELLVFTFKKFKNSVNKCCFWLVDSLSTSCLSILNFIIRRIYL